MSSNMDRRSWVGSVLGAGALYGLELLGGSTRDRIRVYGRPNPENGVNAMKTQQAACVF